MVLGKAITLLESNLESDIPLAEKLLESILPRTGNSIRLGITGIPGVGKSTFIEVLGQDLLNLGKKLAILTVDPSSAQTMGSILGDKTRMENLSKEEDVFIRPSPTGSHLGGVATRTRDVILLCEAAGYDYIIVETVGVGQSETYVKNMVDYFLLLTIAGTGDDLQGIKKGIMEMADGIVINKAEKENLAASKQTKVFLEQALHLFSLPASGLSPNVLLCRHWRIRELMTSSPILKSSLIMLRSQGILILTGIIKRKSGSLKVSEAHWSETFIRILKSRVE